VGETRVDLQHLLEDLRDAYTGALEETILTEIVANALDSGATRISLQPNPTDATLTVVDDGRGMQRRDLAKYHDVAASTKARGEGIGFAGVGIKLGLLVSSEVTTETRRGATHVATRWHLASRYRAPWKWITPPSVGALAGVAGSAGLAGPRGTAVRLSLTNPLSPLLDAGYIEEALRLHFEPLLDPAFDDLLRRHYPHGIAFDINGQALVRGPQVRPDRVIIPIRLGRRRTPSAIAMLERRDHPVSTGVAERDGIAISTFGKVIKRGWDWLGLTPATPSRVSGLIEVPDLAGCLTLSKNDFIRAGPRGATYLAYRKAIQEVVSRQLAAWGDTPDDARPRIVRLERDLERVLEDLADDFPLLRSLVNQRAGGQKRLPLPGRGGEQVPGPLFANVPSDRASDRDDGQSVAPPDDDLPPGDQQAAGQPQPLAPPTGEHEPSDERPHGEPDASPDSPVDLPIPVGTFATVPGRRRLARYGLLLQFESRPDDSELGRLVDSTVWINEAHPAYARATASRSAGYHIALTVALALAPLAVGAQDEHAFITQFLAHWGKQPRRRPTRG
jgi:hypothetical protein